VIPQLALFFATCALCWFLFHKMGWSNWHWMLPVLLLALFIHGTFGAFMNSGGPVHELCHKTPFRTKALNEFFLKVYSFISWADYIGFRPSHVKHHQATVHADHDGEVVLPQKLDWYTAKFFFTQLVFDPSYIYNGLKWWIWAAMGEIKEWIFGAEWMNQVVPKTNTKLRREHRRWAQIVLFGHTALVIVFIATGQWFLIIPFTLGASCCSWLGLLCARPQHIGLSPNVPDFRLCCRTYTCGWLPSFLYWNMQYHVEHHMFPSVPFYNLPKLRKLIEADLPPVTHGLWATWKEIIVIIKKQKEDPNYVFIPKLPQSKGEYADDTVLEREAAEGSEEASVVATPVMS
ncbi:MAG: fatty acid desaturase, partial [Chthoniobacterales bacterium]